MSAPLPGGVQPADFAVVSMGGAGGAVISAMETIAYQHRTWWDHVLMWMGDGLVFQAEPAGAQIRPIGDYDHAIWSTGLLTPTSGQRALILAAARHYAYVRTGYSYLDYAAIGAHRFRIPVPGLRRFIADTGHMICSQAVDQCWSDGGYQIFDDGRWTGYVSPYDLGHLLQVLAVRTLPRSGPSPAAQARRGPRAGSGGAADLSPPVWPTR